MHSAPGPAPSPPASGALRRQACPCGPRCTCAPVIRCLNSHHCCPGAAAAARKTMASGAWKLDSASYFLKFTPGLVCNPWLFSPLRSLLSGYYHGTGCQRGGADAAPINAPSLSPPALVPPPQMGSHNERRLGIFLHSGDPHQGLRTSDRTVSFSFLAFAQSPGQQQGGERLRCAAACCRLLHACSSRPGQLRAWSCAEPVAGCCCRWGWQWRGPGHAAAALHHRHGAAARSGAERGLGPGWAAVQLGGAARAALHPGRRGADHAGRADAAQVAALIDQCRELGGQAR